MRAVLIFDDDGRCIGSEMRSADQMPTDEALPGAFGGAPLEKPAKEMWRFKSHKDWYINDEGKLRKRRKVDLPRPSRQRMHGQPCLRWDRLETLPGGGEPEWQARHIYNPEDIINPNGALWTCGRGGISGDAAPDWFSQKLFEPMPPVVWEPVAPDPEEPAPDLWQSLTIYEAGEMIAALDGARWYRAQVAGISRVYEPDWAAHEDTVADRDYIDLPVPDLPNDVVPILNISGERIASSDGVRIYRTMPCRLSVHLDNAQYYSDPYIISVETPNA